MPPADDTQWQLLVKAHVDCDDWSVVQHCLTMLQTMFVGVTFVLRHASNTQWVHGLAAKSVSIIFYRIEMPCGCLKVPHWNIDE